MTTAPQQPGQRPEPTSAFFSPSIADALVAAEQELARRRGEAAPHLAGLRFVEREVHRLRRQRRAARRRELRRAATRRVWIIARIVLAVYGVIAFIDAVMLFIHGHPSTDEFASAAAAIGAAAVIPSS